MERPKRSDRRGFQLSGFAGQADEEGSNSIYRDVSDITKAPEMLGGRVKTLHPAVHGGGLLGWKSS